LNLELTHREAKSLFGAFVDEDLEPPRELSLKAHLDDCDECRTGWEKYARVVKSTRTLDRQKAPAGLASIIMRRVRRRRMSARAFQLTMAHSAIPAEIVIPVVLAAAVAALLFIAAL